MDHIRIEGVPPYDGRYEFDPLVSGFTVREWGWIKKYSGYLPLTFWDGWRGSDPELMAVFALIALVRTGKFDREDVGDIWNRFQDAPGMAGVQMEFEKREGDAADPPESSTEKLDSSGNGSKTSSERSVETPPDSGTPGSASSESLPVPVSEK